MTTEKSIPTKLLLRSTEVAEFLGFAESCIRRWSKERLHGFPKPVHYGSRCTVWRRSEVVDWAEGRAQFDKDGKRIPQVEPA